MMVRNRCLPRRVAVVLFAVAALGADCNGDIARDPTFRDWCGDSLCAWHLDAGAIRSVPSWNENDRAVAFLETPTQISQTTTEHEARCILFTSVADLDPTAEMSISVDFNADGTVEYTAPLGVTYWQRVETEITAPAAYDGITFTLRKAGPGTAALAEMRIQSTTGCAGPPVASVALALGQRCADSNECAPGLTCAGGPADARCSQCSLAQPCANGGSCSARSVFLPSQCDPGQALGAFGDPCLSGSDCRSGSCAGAVAVPLVADAGPCDFDGSLGAAAPANCEFYAARGGRCQ